MATAAAEVEQPGSKDAGDFQKETQLMYQKLMTKMHHDHKEDPNTCQKRAESPMIASKVMQHISSRLVALMHEVKAASASEIEEANREAVPFADRRQIGPPARRFKRPPMGAKEPEDGGGVRRKSLDDKALWSKENSSGAQSARRRGSLKTESETENEERVSWKGSFDSQLTSSNPRLNPSRHSSANSSTRRSPSPTEPSAEQPRPTSISKPVRQTAPQPKLGTSAIKKQLSDIEPQSVSLATSLAAGPMQAPRSARYKPPGYKKPAGGAPQRKSSPSSPGSVRRPSFADRYTGRQNQKPKRRCHIKVFPPFL